jgi:hypothetical protein
MSRDIATPEPTMVRVNVTFFAVDAEAIVG